VTRAAFVKTAIGIAESIKTSAPEIVIFQKTEPAVFDEFAFRAAYHTKNYRQKSF